jgi:hypothetical protein
MHHFQEFGKPLGISLNLHKNNMTSTNGQPSLSYLSSHDPFHLRPTIDYLKESSGSQTSPEIAIKIEYTTFANDYITKSFDTSNNNLSKLTSQIHNLQTQAHPPCLIICNTIHYISPHS